MLRFNTFRSGRYLRSKFVEGKYLLASEATDLELEVMDLLRKVVNSTIGDVAIEDAFKVERLSDTQILIKPGQAWFKGLPFAMRGGKDQLVTGAILSLGTVPVGTTATDDSTGLGKVITFNSGSTTPSALYRIVITAREELITEVDDPFLQNVNLTESTAQKIRLLFQLNIVPESLQTESPIPYRDEASASGSVTNFPNSGGMAAPNFVNQISVTPTAGGNGELLAINPISGLEGIDGRDLELVVRNNPSIGGGNPIPRGLNAPQAFANGKLIDSLGNVFHVNLIFDDTVNTQSVIRIDKEPDQPNPQIINTLPYTLLKRDVYVTDDSNGVPQGKLHWAIATVDWSSTDGIDHDSKVVDLRVSVSKQDEAQRLLMTRDNLEMVGGGNISFDLAQSMLTWPEDFSIVNPHGPLQTIAAGQAPLVDGGSLAYEMDLESGGPIQRGTLSVTVTGAGTTATLAAVDLADVRLGNVLVDSTGALHVITIIDNVNDTVTASTSIAAGAAVIYKDSFGPEKAPLSSLSFILAVRSGDDVLVGGEEEESDFEDRNLKLVRGGIWNWGGTVGPEMVQYDADDLENASLSNFSATDRLGMALVVPTNFTATKVTFRMQNSGSTGSIVLDTYSDTAGEPGTLLDTSAAIDVSTIGGPTQDVQFTLTTPVALTSGQTYYFIVRPISLSSPASLSMRGGNPQATHPENSIEFSVDGGATWGNSLGAFVTSRIDGTAMGAADTLSWDQDAFISIPGLTEDRNTIPAGDVTLANDGEVAYVNINRDAGAPANLTVQVAAIEDLVSTEDLVIIARRTGNNVIVGNQSTLLEEGQSSELYAQMSEQQKAFMGGGPADSTNYSSENYVTDGDSLEDAIGILDNEVFNLSGSVAAIQWKDPVANFAALPAVGNTDGDNRLVLDTRVIYSWKASATAWVETGRWKSPVANAAALPTLNNLDGDVRITLDTRVAYHWEQSSTSWKPLNGTGGGVKIIGGGTVGWVAPNLTFTADMYLEMKGLAYTDNTIQFSTQSPIVLSSSLDVAYVIPNLASGGPNLTVVVGALASVPANAIIIARREGSDVIVGSSSTRLKNGQTTELYAQESIQSRNTLRSTDFLRSDNPVTWTGTELQFTSDIVLETMNVRTGQNNLYVIDVGDSPLALADGEIAYLIIDRTDSGGATSILTGMSVPTATSETFDYVIIGKRVDANGAGYLHIPLHKQVLEPGQTVRLGASGSGSGNASEIIETVKNRLLDSTFDLATPNVFALDGEDNVDGASTGAYSLVTKTFDMAVIGETLVTSQLLDANEFLNNDNFLKEVELLAFWTQGFIDPIATYEVSRDGGGEWQTVDMERVGNTELFRGVHVFDDEAVNAVLQQQALATSDGDNDLDDGTARQKLGQAFTVTDKQLVKSVRLRINKVGSPSGNYKVSIVNDNAGSPGTTVYSESALLPVSGLSAGANDVSIDVSDTILIAGTYHIVFEADAAYRASYSNGVTEIALRSLVAGTPVARAYDGTVWSALTSKTVFEVVGITLDLRVRITSGTTDVKLDGYAVLYDRLPGLLATGVKELEVFQVNGSSNTVDFAVNNFLVNPELLRVYDVNTGQVYRYGAFTVNGNTVSFTSGQFYDPGNTITLIFDQTSGGTFDNSDANALLLATNHLGSSDATIDRSIAGRGIFLRRPDGTLREICIDDNDNIVVYSV